MTRLFSLVAVLFTVFGLLLGQAAAVNPDEMLEDPVLEQRARDLSQKLRCLVCQNQSIDDSDADLARDLRIIVRQRLVAGDSDDETIQYIVDRYGEYVLLEPPVKGSTYLLWFAPAILLAAGGAGLAIAAYRRRQSPPAPDELSEDEKRRLAQLTESGGKG